MPLWARTILQYLYSIIIIGQLKNTLYRNGTADITVVVLNYHHSTEETHVILFWVSTVSLLNFNNITAETHAFLLWVRTIYCTQLSS
jgi:hypothetical protein